MELTIEAGAHARRVTLNLAARSDGTPPEIKPIVSRLAMADWDYATLSKTDHETLYAALDNDTTATILLEWEVDTDTIRDWGHPFAQDGSFEPWYTGGDREVDCELCGHQHNRWEFLASNRVNGRTCWMGSTCVEKYKFVVDGEATAEASLGRLRGAVNRAKRAQTRAEWRAAHPTADDVIATITGSVQPALRRMSYRQGRLHNIHVKGWVREMRGFVSRVKAATAYYQKHGYLTDKRTAEVYGPLLAMAGRIVKTWAAVDDVTTRNGSGGVLQLWWDAWIAQHDAVLSADERALADRKSRYGDAWGSLRAYELEKLTAAVDRLAALSAPAVAPALPPPVGAVRRRRPPPPPPVNVEAEAAAGEQGFAARLRNHRAKRDGNIVSENPRAAAVFDDCPWNE